jgi:uncharacterized protein YbaA (DUF1428 family)
MAGTGNPWTEAETARLVELHGQGRSLHSIAKEMGRGKAQVSREAAKAGLSWRREQTKAAAEAHAADGKLRRARIASRMYERMEKIQDRLDAAEVTGFRTTLKAAGGRDEQVTLEFVPTADERNLADTLSRYVMAATKLQSVDASNGAEGERSLLSELGTALGVHRPDAGDDPA